MSKDQDRIDLIRRTQAPEASDDEFKIFMDLSERLNLDPLRKQLMLVSRKGVHQTQLSIDAFRLVAQRTGKYRGQTPTEWCGKDGVWKDVWLNSSPPVAARVGIHHRDFVEPLYSVARFEAYAQRKNDRDRSLFRMWKKMGDVMIAKCAESLGLRRSFPDVLSGLYSTDEMAQAINDPPGVVPPPVSTPALAKIVEQQSKTIAEEFERMLYECRSIAEIDELVKKVPDDDMSEDEKRSARIVYAKAKAAIAAEVMAG